MLTITTTHRTHLRPPAPATPHPTVFIIHGDHAVRETLESCVEPSDWDVRTFGSAQEFLLSPRVLAPSCLILDVDLPDLNGLDVQKRVAASRPDMPVIFITSCGDVATSVTAMKAGAIEFLTTPVKEAELLAVIADALERSAKALVREARMATLRQSYASLTPREREVMALVASGLLNKQVGGELGISVITVKAHRGQVMRKMKAGSLPALVHMVASLGVAAAVAQ
jgi:FixJ family two-component response regulator